MGFLSNIFGRSNNTTTTANSSKLRAAQPYDAIVALDPPVKGSYPVAGNGPNVLEEIQRTRAKRQSMASVTAPQLPPPPPQALRQQDDRPRTAPHDGTPGGGHGRTKSMKSTRGRTLSGFSTKSPPSIFARRNSTRSTFESPPPPLPPPVPQVYSPPPSRDIRTYMPSTGIANANASPEFVPPFAQQQQRQQHNRHTSTASHKSYVDILDAHSSIKKSRAASLHRSKASGMRNYGEDVADRNIADYGAKTDRESKLDFNSPELSYLKSVYAPKRGTIRGEPNSRTASALGHVLGTDAHSGDDTATGQIQPRTNSMRSTTSVQSGLRPTSVFPPRVDSASATALSYSNNLRTHDDRRSIPPSGPGGRARALSPLSSATASISEEPSARRSQPHQSQSPVQLLPAPPVPERGRARPTSVITSTTTTSTTSTTSTQRISSPFIPPASQTTAPQGRQTTRPRENSFPKNKLRSMSTAPQNTAVPSSYNGGSPTRKASVTYSAFPERTQSTSRPSTANPTKRPDMAIEGSSQPISLEGVVDLQDSVDTEVITKTLPAVVHEHVTPTRHEIRQEVVTREIHHHDVYHRVLPVIETEILPTKHYVKSPDGKSLIEIPEAMVPNHKVTGKLDQNWHISRPGPGSLSNEGCETASRSSTDSAPDGPIIGLARGEPRPRPRGNSKASSLTSKIRGPILSSKKESITGDGVPKTEYVWRHPPVFETATGETQPMYIGTALGEPGTEEYYTDDDGEFDRPKSFAKGPGEEGLLFRDSGYGSGGMLPGLTDKTPAATGNGAVSAARQAYLNGLENGMRNMSVR